MARNAINCKVELKLRWTKHCVLSVAGTDNANGNDGIITKLYISVVTTFCSSISKIPSKITKTS